MADYTKPPNPYAETTPLVTPTAPAPQPAYYAAPPPTYDQSTPVVQAPVPQYAYGYQQAPVAYQGGAAYQTPVGYQAPAGYAIVVTDQHHVHHSERKENEFLWGCLAGWFCGLFGLLCLLCVRDRRAYIRGWLIPFIITLIVGVVFMILVLTGVIATY